MNELKSCPFCGSDNLIIIEHIPDIFENRYHVLCTQCLCRGASKFLYEDAVKSWNRRVNEKGNKRKSL